MQNCCINFASQEDNLNKAIDNLVYELPYIAQKSERIQKPKIENMEDTIDALINSNASFCRFGDGELILIQGGEIHFQKADQELACHLKKILTSQNENIFIGINYQYYYADLDNFHPYPKFFYRTYIHEIRNNLNLFLLPDKQYYSAGITSAYVMLQEYDYVSYFSKIRQIWQNKDVTIICGDSVFANIEYNIFDSAKSIEYQYAPSINAFDNYDEIFKNAQTIDKNRMIIIILGPTAKVLTYDLAIRGYRALDLGHIAKDYNAYMQGMPRNKQTIGKFFEPD